jgi:hypothetical protein
MRLWINQQLRRHHLDPATVWRIVQAPSSTSRLHTVFISPAEGDRACRA